MPKVPNLNNINNADANAPSDDEDQKQEFTKDTKFFKSSIAGLAIQIGDEPSREEQPSVVRFTPYEFRDEKRGENYTVGYLATEEQDALEVLADDPNVTEIDEKEFRDVLENGKRAKY